MNFKTEDKVRDEAKKKLNLFSIDKVCISDVGQLTTFNQLNFKGINDKPDGWYLPLNLNEPALVLECKNSNEYVNNPKWIQELQKNIDIVHTKYKKVIGILYNGYDVLVIKDNKQVDLTNNLLSKEYYVKTLYNQNQIDKNLIYSLTAKINNILHFDFGIKNLSHRMVFTACSLVAKRYNAVLVKGMDWVTLQQSIVSTLNKSYENDKKINGKLDIIGETFASIKANLTDNQEKIDEFIDCIEKISDNINSDYWNGEDVMGIFFNEFTRYKGKTEQGQVFTPDHITSLMYRICGVSYKDRVLDACCGSGAFLVKAMRNMIKEVGGINNECAVKDIKHNKLFGIEFDKEVYTLACANMMIHKDGKTNIIQDDTRKKEIGEWIKSKHITKVLMNPPYEEKYGCIKIIENVLDNVEQGAICGFILSDQKLETKQKHVRKMLKKHTLQKIIKLSEETFQGMVSTTTSIFIFKAGEPQNNKSVFACYIKDDGLITIKNQGRHDYYNKWQDIENYWVDVIYKQNGNDTIQFLDVNEILKYKIPEPKFSISENEIKKNVLDYVLFKNKIKIKELNESVLNYIWFGEKNNLITSKLITFINNQTQIKQIDISNWKPFLLKNIFEIKGAKKKQARKIVEKNGEGKFPYITTQATDNGVAGYFNAKTEEKDVLTIDSAVLGTCFYQSKEFTTSDHVEILKPLNFILNDFKALFLVSVINKVGKIKGYSFTTKRSQQALKKEIIYLPINNKYKENDIKYNNANMVDFNIIEQIIKPIFETVSEVFK